MYYQKLFLAISFNKYDHSDKGIKKYINNIN